jgi:L-seryl-tRNA(Ser) seleniumtransferase
MSTAAKEPYDRLVDLASLGIEPVINANTTQTRLGGSLMPEPVLDAMRVAARRFVDIEELQAAAGRRLATLTRNEAAYVSAGAATGLMLATLAAMTGPDTVAAQRVADGRESRLNYAEVIVQAPQWTPYERSIRLRRLLSNATSWCLQ